MSPRKRRPATWAAALIFGLAFPWAADARSDAPGKDARAPTTAAVGQLQWADDLDVRYGEPGNVKGVAVCSGTLIARDLFLTAGHCVDAVDGGGWVFPKGNGTLVNITPAQAARELRVNFVARGESGKKERSAQAGLFRSVRVVELVEHRLGGGDWALLRLERQAQLRGCAMLGDRQATAGATLTIIGHPDGGQQRLDTGKVERLVGGAIEYSGLETASGSSGSGLFAGQGFALVGIHTEGNRTADATGVGIKRGLAIEGIIASSPTLQKLQSAPAANACAPRVQRTSK